MLRILALSSLIGLNILTLQVRAEVQLRGLTLEGSHKIDSEDYLFATFTYDGALSRVDANSLFLREVQKMKQLGKSSYPYRFRNTSSHESQFALQRNQVFVLGWYNVHQGSYGWLAVNRDDAVYPSHTVLISDGSRKRFQSTGGPEDSMISERWEVGQKELLILRVRSNSGYISWWCDWRSRN